MHPLNEEQVGSTGEELQIMLSFCCCFPHGILEGEAIVEYRRKKTDSYLISHMLITDNPLRHLLDQWISDL